MAKNKAIKKQLDPKKCVNYMDIPVCPECGSPNLQSLGQKEGKDYWVCTRCYTPCWTDDSFDMDFGADNLRYDASTKKSKVTGIKKFDSNLASPLSDLLDMAKYIDESYQYCEERGIDTYSDNESVLYNAVENGIDQLLEDMERLADYLQDMSMPKSTKKSKYSDIHKRLAKLGGFTKEDDERKIPIEDDDVVEIEDEDGEKVVEIESEETHDKEVGDGEESNDDNLNACGKYSANKKRMKMKKGEDMPADADDFQNDNQKGSGNAGSTLPENADDQQDQNEKGSGNAGSELPEDADEQENITEKARKMRIERMKSRQKGVRKNVPPVRKFSVTNGGSPDQTSYNGRYQQSPMVRDAIDGHFGSKADKSFDEVAMMQDRIDNLMKSRRNPSANNGVPKKLR